MMTKRDFIKIAQVFEQVSNMSSVRPGLIAEMLGTEFAKINPRFDRDKFLDACRGKWTAKDRDLRNRQ